MMKKLLVSGLAFLGTLALYAQPVFAGTDTPTPDTDEVAQSGTASTDASISLTGGLITLLQAPSLNFGTHEITAKTQDITIDAKTSGNGLSKSIAVQNAGQASGWHVTMQVGQFNGDNGYVLKGATLTLTQNRVTSDSSISVAPTGITNKVVAAAGTSSAPVTVLNAAKDDTNPVGVGLWRSYLNSATLHIPAGNVSGNYTSNLTWTLSNAPQ